MTANQLLSASLKAYRGKTGMTQEEMAALAGLSTRGYANIERAAGEVKTDTLDKLSQATGLSIAQLFDSHDGP